MSLLFLSVGVVLYILGVVYKNNDLIHLGFLIAVGYDLVVDLALRVKKRRKGNSKEQNHEGRN